MALLINCPGCGNRIVNNGQNCPFCGFNVKENKSAEEMEAEAKKAETDVENNTEISQQKKVPVKKSEPVREERYVPTETQQQTVQSEVYEEQEQMSVDEAKELPDIGSPAEGKALPPIEIEKPVPLSKIANTPAVELTPIESEKVDNKLPPMQPEREITIEQIRQTPAVRLTPIEQEEVEDRLPDINTEKPVPSEAAHSEAGISIEKGNVQQPAPKAKRQWSTEPVQQQPEQPQQPAPKAKRQWSTEPVQQQPEQPQQSAPKAKRQWSTEPVQQQQPEQPQQPAPKAKRQWSTEPIQQQQPEQPQQPAPKAKRQWSTEPVQQQPEQPQQPAPKAKKQWSAEPVQPQQPQQPAPKAKRQWSSEPVQQQQPQQPHQPQQPVQKANRQWSASPKTENNSSDSDDDFIANFKREFEKNNTPSFDVNAPLNTAPRNNYPQVPLQQTQNKKMPVAGIVVVVALIVAIVVIVFIIMSGNGESEPSQDSSVSVASSSASTSPGQSDSSVKFKKPDGWGDKIYAYVYNSEGAENAKWPGVEMTADGDGTYSYTLPDDIKDGLIIFNEGEGDDKRQYPGKQQEGLKVTAGTVYSVEDDEVGSDIVINFTKPDSWDDSVNVYVYQDGSSKIKNADWPGEAMTKNSDGTYSYTIKAGTFDAAKLVFNDGDSQNQYPKSGGLAAEDGKMYTVE